MTKPSERYELTELIELARDKERNRLELKNSAPFVLLHPLQDRRITNTRELKEKTSAMLVKECSALANSGGGVLVVGFNDDGTLDPTPVPEKLEGSNSLTQKWVEDILHVRVEPSLTVVDAYYLSDGKGAALVIEIDPSDTAPHQSLDDLLYYVRAGTSAVPARHWLIEAIRNRRIHPSLKPELLWDESSVYRVDGNGNSSSDTMTLNLIFNIENVGTVMADQWAVRFDCLFANETRIFPENIYPRVSLPTESHNGIVMSKGTNPLFPTQATKLIARIIVPAHWQIDSSLGRTIAHFGWSGIKDAPSDVGGRSDDGRNQWFFLDLTLYADNGPKVVKRETIETKTVWLKLVTYLQQQGRLKS